MPDDIIKIVGLRVFAYHGVLASEKEEGQEFLIDVEVVTDFSRAAADDRLSDTIDYASVARSVAMIATDERYDLIESLAVRLAEHLLTFGGASKATVTIGKPEAPLDVRVDWVGVTVSRTAPGGPT